MRRLAGLRYSLAGWKHRFDRGSAAGRLSYSSVSLPETASILRMPALSPTMTQGSISVWSLSEGKPYGAGDVLCEVETDKATVDFEAVEEGFLAKIFIGDNAAKKQEIPVGEPIAIVTETEEDLKAVQAMSLSLEQFTEKPAEKIDTSADTTSVTDKLDSSSSVELQTSKRTSPAAGILLQNHHLNTSGIQGTGKHGIITKGDVLAALKGTTPLERSATLSSTVESAVAASTGSHVVSSSSEVSINDTEFDVPVETYDQQFTDEALTNMRKVIATRLTHSKQNAPHYYITVSCEVDEAMSLRKKIKARLDTTFSLNDLVIAAVAKSLKDVPSMNINVEGSTTNGLKLVHKDDIDISVAVATEAGLITPIIKNADRKGLLEINASMKDLAGRARKNKLKLDEYQGGTFTISNLGMFGINSFTAVINEPQVAILAVGNLKPKLKPKSKTTMGQGRPTTYSKKEVKVVNEMTVALSFDRRAVAEDTAGQFLQCFQQYMSDPALMQM